MLLQKEVELKFEVEPSAWRLLNKNQIIKALNKRAVQTAEASVYFDTDKHKLHKKGLLLRVRRIGKTSCSDGQGDRQFCINRTR